MLSELEETLERRIRIMTMPFPKKPWLRGMFLTALGGVLLAVACWTPSPNDATEGEEEVFVSELPPPATDVEVDISAAPTFTPYTVRPDIRNRAEVARALEAEYPPLLRDAGIGGTVQIWFLMDENGVVQKTLMNESSGHQALDEAALEVAAGIEFTPALNRDKPVPVWISLPITFATAGAPGEGGPEQPPEVTSDPPEAGAGRERVGVSPKRMDIPPPKEVLPTLRRGDLSAAPTFTPYTVRPDIRNRAEVARALEAEYPASLRDEGIGGTVQVWFFIDENGRVQRTQINQSSGHEALDDAALRVAGEIQFTPAFNEEKEVPVWISLPITFTTR
jgi:TonB family protein